MNVSFRAIYRAAPARLARLTRSVRPLVDSFAPVAALVKVRTGVAQVADLLEMGLGGSA